MCCWVSPGEKERKKERKKEKTQFLAPSHSVCKRRFVEIWTGLMDVKLLAEHVGEGLNSWKCAVFWDMYVFVMYYIYGVFGSSLLIESTDSMI